MEKIIQIYHLSDDGLNKLSWEITNQANRIGIPVALCIVNQFGTVLRHQQDIYTKSQSFNLAMEKAKQVAMGRPPTGIGHIFCKLEGGFPILSLIDDQMVSLGGVGVSGGAPRQDCQIVVRSLKNLDYYIHADWQRYIED